MLVQTLDGETYEWKISEKIAKGNKRKTSSYHSIARKLLNELFPNHQIYEEVPIVTSKGKQLYLDFYIKTINLAVEVHGKQHYSFSNLFHQNKTDLLKQKVNDEEKITWCETNGIKIIILPYNKEKEWKLLITN